MKCVVILLLLLCLVGCSYTNQEPMETSASSPAEPTLSHLSTQSNIDFFETLEGATHANLLNGGYSVSYKGAIYYRNGTDFTDNNLYRMSLEDGSVTLISNKKCSFLSIADDYIYFINDDDSDADEYFLCKMNLEGADYYRYPVKCREINVTEHSIFYIDDEDENIYKMNRDGSNKVKITNDKRCFNLMVYNNWVYYIDASDFKGLGDKLPLLRLNLSTPYEEQVLIDDCIEAFIYEDKIYYTNYSEDNASVTGLFRINLDGTNKDQISPYDAYSVNAYNGYIVFYIEDEDKSDSLLYRCLFDGSDLMLITDEYRVNSMHIHDDKIIFERLYAEHCEPCMINIDGTGYQELDLLSE